MKKLLNYNIAKNSSEAFKIVKENLTEDYLSQFKIEFSLEYDESKKIIMALGKGFELICKFEKDYVSSEIKLSLLIRPFKKKIMHLLKKQLEQVL